MMRFGILVAFIFSICPVSMNAQIKDLEALCSSIKDKVVVSQYPVKLSRDEIYVDECEFRFSTKRSKYIRLEVEKFESDAAAFIELKSRKESFGGRDALEYKDKKTRDRRVEIDPNGFWDSAEAYRNIAVPDHFILLRRGKYVILILGDNFSEMKKTERLLRGITF